MEARGFHEGEEIMSTVIKTELGTAWCIGVHHKDSAKIVNCERCGCWVAKVKKGYIEVRSGEYGFVMNCWADQHVCKEENVEGWTSAKNYRIAQGEIVIGQTVTVVRGRKVPIGTTGEIRWIGEDSYGNMKVGIRVNGEMLFTALKNVEVAA
jgi:hypothetical protein